MNGHAQFESKFLEELATAFRKRRKALVHGPCRVANFAKVYELVGGEKTERLEIHTELIGPKGALLRLHAWPDRLVWLDARQAAKTGWAWSWTFEGRLVGEDLSRAAIKALEESCSLVFSMESLRTNEFSEAWASLLARGPQIVK